MSNISKESEKNSIKMEEEQQIKNEQIDYGQAEGEGEGEGEVEGEQDDQGNSGNGQQPGSALLEGGSQQLTKKRTHRKLDISNFIMKTYRILQDKRNSVIVEWTEQGNCFIVKDKQKFSREILPKYFKHSKFSSFVRQLNMYDFHKIRKEKQIPIFKHKYFKEGSMQLLHKIKRKNGEDGRDEDGVSKQLINFSEPLIGGPDGGVSRQLIGLKHKSSVQISTQSEIEILRKQNHEINTTINEVIQEIELLELNKEKKKEKLLKIVSSLMFFDLGDTKIPTTSTTMPTTTFTTTATTPTTTTTSTSSSILTLRDLQKHFLTNDDPLSFSEYQHTLAQIYSSLKNRLIL